MDKEAFIKRLMEIDGVSYDIAAALYKTGYRNANSFNDAIIEDLMLVKGVNPTLARRILNNIKSPKESTIKPGSVGPEPIKPLYDMKRVWFVKASLWSLFYIWIMFGWFIVFDFIIGGLLITGILIISSIVFIIISRIWASLFYDTYFYQIKESEIIIEYGVLFHKRTTIPFKRIQNVNVVQGPIMRFYGLKSIQMETAGSTIYRPGPTGTGLSEGQIPAPEKPEELADMIIEMVKKYKAAEGL
jgi:membrane protein YdbS with pleckstrin-like domain